MLHGKFLLLIFIYFIYSSVYLLIPFIGVQSLSHVQLFATSWTARLLCPSLSPRVCSNSCLMCQWFYLTISSSATPMPIYYFPASGSFPMSCLWTWSGQSIGTSGSISILPMNISSSFPLRSPGLNSLLSKGLSRVFSSTTIHKHQFFGSQPSLWSNSHACMLLLEKL